MTEEEKLAQELSDKALNDFLEKHGEAALRSLEKRRQGRTEATLSEETITDDVTAKTSTMTVQDVRENQINLGVKSNTGSKTPSEISTEDSEEGEHPSTPIVHRKVGAKSGTGAMMTPGGHIDSADTRAIPIIGKQAEHASAYVLFEELAYSSIEGVKVTKAAELLRKSFETLPLAQEVVDEICSEAEKDRPVITKKERKEITRAIRGNNYFASQSEYLEEHISSLPEDHPSKRILEKGQERARIIDEEYIKSAIVSSNMHHASSCVTAIMDSCLYGSNRMENVTFPKEGVPDNPNTGEEKGAKNDLKLLSNFLLEIKEINDISGEDKLKRLEELDFKDLEDRWNISRIRIIDLLSKGTEKTFQEKLDDLLDLRVGDLSADLQHFSQDIDTIQKYKGGKRKEEALARLDSLINEPQSEYRAFLQNECNITQDDLTSLKENPDSTLFYLNLRDKVDQTRPMAVQDKISQRMGHLFYYPRVDPDNLPENSQEWQEALAKGTYTQGTKPRDNNPDTMYEVVGRHIVLTMNCFRGLSEFETENQKQLVREFLNNSILKQQGWNQEPEFNLKKLNDGITEYSTLDHETGNFYTTESLKDIENQKALGPRKSAGKTS